MAFILLLGYFKARHLFVVFKKQAIEQDRVYVATRYFPDVKHTVCVVAKGTRLKHQQLILSLCQYTLCTTTDRQALFNKACEAARVSGKPIFIFRQLLLDIEARRITLPRYSFLQDTVSRALHWEQTRLTHILRAQLRAKDIAALDAQLADTPGLLHLIQLKREPRDLSGKEVHTEIARGQQIRELYQRSHHVLAALQISSESIKYYASLVNFYAVSRLKRLESWAVYLYLLCFLHHRYQRHHDHLLISLRAYVRKTWELAKVAAQERVYDSHVQANQNVGKAAQVMKLFTTAAVPYETPFGEVQTQAFAILPREQIDQVADHMTAQERVDETAFQWEHIEHLSLAFKRYIRPIFLAIDIKGTPGQAPLMKAVKFLQTAFRKGRLLSSYPIQDVPLACLPESFRRYTLGRASVGKPWGLMPDRYEFGIYRLVCERLDAGDIYCRESVRFRSFEDDLIDENMWVTQKETLLAQVGLPMLQQPIEEHLATLEEELETQLAAVNERIAQGENQYITVKSSCDTPRWSLRYPQDEDDTNHPIFDTLKQVDIGSVLTFANDHTKFMNAFTHILGRYVKTAMDKRAITAALIAWGTNTGLSRMGQISDIGYPLLAARSENFIRLETLREANECVSNAIAEMAIFRKYDLDGKVHSSSDGQKFETGLPTFNARHAPKYFGLKKGVVAYTMVANHIPVNAKVIGANEHESHYVFDLLFNNTSQVQPTIHSTDTHGTNEVNFAILSAFGYQFAPRYRNIAAKVASSLYGFKFPGSYRGLLRPVRTIQKALIIDDWDWVQRIMVSLALKTTTQSIITGKLSSYARHHKTRAALWEYDNIIRSLYLLRYIDEPPLRRNVQVALNRGENYHKLRKAVAYANFGKLRFKNEHEQQIWQECSRLITNCIIFYNAMILSTLLVSQHDLDEEQDTIVQFCRISPVAWQHINLHGRYEFIKKMDPINIQEIVRMIAGHFNRENPSR